MPVAEAVGLTSAAVAEIVKAILDDRASQRAFDLEMLNHGTKAQQTRYLETIIKREESAAATAELSAKNIAWWQARADNLGDLIDGEDPVPTAAPSSE